MLCHPPIRLCYPGHRILLSPRCYFICCLFICCWFICCGFIPWWS